MPVRIASSGGRKDNRLRAGRCAAAGDDPSALASSSAPLFALSSRAVVASLVLAAAIVLLLAISDVETAKRRAAPRGEGPPAEDFPAREARWELWQQHRRRRASAQRAAGESRTPNGDKPLLHVVVLAGQSNMVGMGSMEHLDLLVGDGCRRPSIPATGGTSTGRGRRRRLPVSPSPSGGGDAALLGKSNGVGRARRYRHQRRDDNYRARLCNESSHSYKVSDRVYVKFGDAAGRLTAGPRSGYAAPGCFGPELMIGWTLHDEAAAAVAGSSRPVAGDDDPTSGTPPTFLLVKAAWGGKSLAVDFRPPSSGLGNFSASDVAHGAASARARAASRPRPLDYGRYYRAAVDEVLQTLDRLPDYVPDYDARFSSFRLAGLVWFQGWNDLIEWPFVEEYGRNLENLIRDVRADLSSPDLPVVIGELGMHGTVLDPREKGTPRVLAMRTQQHAVALVPEFRNGTLFVPTAPYVVPSRNGTTRYYNGQYHYGGRADTYFRIGQALGRGLLRLAPGLEASTRPGRHGAAFDWPGTPADSEAEETSL